VRALRRPVNDLRLGYWDRNVFIPPLRPGMRGYATRERELQHRAWLLYERFLPMSARINRALANQMVAHLLGQTDTAKRIAKAR
jgi:hypothetical protein